MINRIVQLAVAIGISIIVYLPNAFAQSEPMRLISTDASATELIFALGADQDLVAVDVTSQLPKSYRELGNIGYHRTLSAEGLLSLRPTTVIGNEHMGPANVLTALKNADVELVQLPSAQNLSQLRNNIDRLARMLSRRDEGEQLIRRIDEQLNHLKSNSLSGMRTAFLLAIDPDKPRLAGANTSGSALIALLDGANVASFDNYRNVSAESLLALQPDIIIVAGREQKNAVNELLAANPILKNTPAGKQKHILAIDSNTLIAGLSVAALDQAIKLAEELQPDTP
ncbi:hemin ABC transporter substrate-binding protein [Microbulbifer sp. TYP-18]|uniref:hemin ABC transporter substrate-binding protein n=1 Tax=Microbulbifer sp. TYP-18 TaxID=3230024 RepID=UPI0034C5DB4E